MGAMRIKASRVKQLIRRKMRRSDRADYLQSLVSSMNSRTQVRGVRPGEALILSRSPQWELYAK